MNNALREPSPHHWAKRQLTTGDYENMRNNGMTAGLDGYARVDGSIEDGDTDLLPAYEMIKTAINDSEFIKRVYKVGIGNPVIKQYSDGHPLTHSDITNLFNAWHISQYLHNPKHIVEIGGGFGCLAAMLKRLWPDVKITLVDLEDSLKLQKYYLEQSFPDNHNDFVYIQDMEGLENIDLVINIRSMMEMTFEQVEYYLNKIQELNVKWFYCVNRYAKHGLYLQDYPFDDNWKIHISQPLFAQWHIHEYMLERGEGRFKTHQRTMNDIRRY